MVDRFRDRYAPSSRKCVSTDPKVRLFQYLKNKVFRSQAAAFNFQKHKCFHWNSVKNTLSVTPVMMVNGWTTPTST